ncbi:MAG: hypothetical protein HDS66_02305 [Bacteroidales bacterium]|nr:hypothetical protein [Bacteroidales bacterium]
MKSTLLLSALLGICLFGACSSEEPIQSYSQTITPINDNRISPEEAIASAQHCVEMIAPTQTRTSKERQVKSLEVVGRSNILTRSGEKLDTLMYIINFEDEAGFAIMSADRRALPVYAISDEGRFEITDNTNEGVKLLLKGMEDDIIDKMSNDFYPTKWPDPWEMYMKTYVGPNLSPFQRALGPNAETSKYCVNTAGQPALTNRVAIVIEQYISSALFTNRFFRWDKIIDENDIDEVAKVVKRIGDSMHLQYKDLNNVAEYTEIEFDNAFNDMEFVGMPYEPGPFSENEDLIQYILNDQSDYFGGVMVYAPKSEISDESLWMIDGYAGCLRPVGNNGMIEYEIFQYLYHCVWGDGGTCNGYYCIGTSGNCIGEPSFIDKTDMIPYPSGFKANARGAIIFLPVHLSMYTGI